LAWAPRASGNGRFPRAERLIEHPSDPNQLVLAATYGLLVTKDRGQNWRFVCEASFAHDPAYMGDPLLDFVGDGSLLVGVQTSMSVSSDQGCDWAPTLREPDAFIVDHAVAKSNPSIVVAAVAVAGAGTVSNTLRESVDGGRTWTSFGTPLPAAALMSIDIDPQDPRRLYATSIDGGAGRFLRSVDHGATWTASSIPGTDWNAVPYIAAVLPTDSNRIFVRTDAPGQVAETGDALLSTDDGGMTWREIHRSRARLLGFALSPDASRMLVGYGDPGPGAATTLPGPFGVFESSTTQFSFERVFGGPVNCIGWTASGIYLCSNETRNGFELAFARDSDLHADGGCFEPILHRDAVRGPLSCASGTSGAACEADWPMSCARLGACSSDAGSHVPGCVPDPPPTTGVDAGEDGGAPEGGEPAVEPASSGCGCRMSAPRGSEGRARIALAVVGFVALVTRWREARARRRGHRRERLAARASGHRQDRPESRRAPCLR
jgi:photosystem II stability/assembly factor-like uncharacterized protein